MPAATGTMPYDILREFETSRTAPVAAMRAALDAKEDMLPVFLAEFEVALHTPFEELRYPASYAIMFHILGQWADPRAYVPLTHFLRLDGDKLDMLIGGSITETADRVIAAVAADDLTPIIGIILDQDADLFIRSGMIVALLRIAIAAPARRPAVVAFIEEFRSRVEPGANPHLLMDWAAAVAVLGLAHLEALARETILDDPCDVSTYSISGFEDDLRRAMEDPSGSWFLAAQHRPGPIDAIREVSGWYCYSEACRQRQDEEEAAIKEKLASVFFFGGSEPGLS
jgi:hypothetical protein